MIAETVRISMNITEFIVAVGITFAAGLGLGLWISR